MLTWCIAETALYGAEIHRLMNDEVLCCNCRSIDRIMGGQRVIR